MAYNAIPTRPHVLPSHQVMELIARSHCWHFDAWMLRHPDTGLLFVRIQTRAGGRDMLTDHSYVFEQGRLRYVPAIPAECEAITMQDQREWPNYDELSDVHSRYVLPYAARVPDNFKSRSVALHYVRAPSLAPFDGTELNMHHSCSNSNVPG